MTFNRRTTLAGAAAAGALLAMPPLPRAQTRTKIAIGYTAVLALVERRALRWRAPA